MGSGGGGSAGISDNHPEVSSDLTAIRSSSLLRMLPLEAWAEFLSLGKPVTAERDATLLWAGDDRAILLLSGLAVADVVGRNGSSVVVGFLGPGGVAGLPVVLGQPAAGINVVALTSVEALLFRGGRVRDYLVNQPLLATACLRTISEELASAREDVVRQTGASTFERVVDRLVQLAEQWGREENDEVHITIPLTQEMLASWARASRESTAKALHVLRRDGIIRTARRQLTILDIGRLGLEARRHQPHSSQPVRQLLDLLA